MRFSVDAHAIGQNLTGNETYIRNLLNCFEKLDDELEILAYVSRTSAFPQIPSRFEKRMVSDNPFRRLGFDLPRRLRQDRPDLIHVQYTAPLSCPVPVVVSVHDISFIEHPEFLYTVPRAPTPLDGEAHRPQGGARTHSQRIFQASHYPRIRAQ